MQPMTLCVMPLLAAPRIEAGREAPAETLSRLGAREPGPMVARRQTPLMVLKLGTGRERHKRCG
jgi:hypothetical protein